ncbi:matrixin family metalloprotease [Alkalicoccus urumqiensis]|uniref:matrixin family metalloprotease n=1 Tax=Alkalicoccus urumqiensis TaxID=1548213 RepID=UPI0011578630|nr:matrixin family metalloprotease [Alkalicoccus urumqiensis]
MMIFAALLFVTPVTATANDLTGSAAYDFVSNVPTGTWDNATSNSAHSSAFSHAVSQLNDVTSGINLSLTTSGQNITARSTSGSADGYYGLWSPNSSGASSGGTIYINATSTSADNFIACNYNKTAMHEFGHAMGLTHQNNATSTTVMKQGQFCFNDYTQLDKNNLRYQY